MKCESREQAVEWERLFSPLALGCLNRQKDCCVTNPRDTDNSHTFNKDDIILLELESDSFTSHFLEKHES